MCVLGRGVPLCGQLCLPNSAPSPSSQKYSWAETRSPHPPRAVWPAQSSRIPDAGFPAASHALGAPPYHPQDLMQKRP